MVLLSPLFLLAAISAAMTLPLLPLHAANLLNDPKGFHDIRWGASLDDVSGLVLVASGERIKEYDLKDGPLPLGEAKVDSMRFFSIDGKFARVAIRYHGKRTHEQVLAYLQSRFGPVDQLPGSMMRGLNQEFTWEGPESQVTLTYEDFKERGFLFIESRTLAPKFLENVGGA